ncbi:MAG: UDP-3-O-(3-hydroxymyristoyl)glucosamine N-acyltransferase [Desulfovibrio sp.]|jgi:UDP-3-O-[3-hydroxymyristoyl] glucosamine N-acyltransferase|nr:UDP-3-O-(3-hydroxymyristoyl)glucosamine N-acyltransferase [Desulfovibrio sp.]
MLLSHLAARLGLTLAGEDREFRGLNTLEAAQEDEVSFLANPRYIPALKTTRACAVILSPGMAGRTARALLSDNPYRDFARASALFARPQGEFSGISPEARIDPSASLGENCVVYPFVFVGPRTAIGAGSTLFPGVYVGEDCLLGARCLLYPGAVLLSGTVLGDDCVLGAGAVLGTDGFGFARMDGRMRKIPQIGSVRLASGVDVGANTCIDRATLGVTFVGRDSKLDNLVQIGHNVTLGEECLLVAQAGLAGSVTAGDRVTIAGQAGIAGHLSLGDDVTVGPQAGVAQDIAPGASGGGSPFMSRDLFLRCAVLAPKLPELHQRVRRLEQELRTLRERLAALDPREDP